MGDFSQKRKLPVISFSKFHRQSLKDNQTYSKRFKFEKDTDNSNAKSNQAWN